MKLLEVIDLHVVVGQNEILHGINLSINEGEVHVLLGPNGSGKTTLLNAIMDFPLMKSNRVTSYLTAKVF